MKRLIFLLSLITTAAQAQFQGIIYIYDGSAPVYMNSQAKSTPWAGGLDNPQVTMGDLNNDGKQDMVIFERNPRQWRTFINTGTAGNPYYVFQPRYIANFPTTSEYLTLADYNDDSIPDLFSHNGVYGFTAYTGYYNTNQELSFTYYAGLTYSNDTFTNPPIDAYVKNGDVPCVFDIDDDGDLDFFAYDADGAYIYYYQNYQVEDALPPDSIRIKLRDKCWGKIRQGSARTHIMPYACSNVGLLRSSGSRDGSNSICIFDADGDGDYDLLDGNNQYSDVQFFRNGIVQTGYPVDTMVYQDTIWQNVLMPQYPSAFHVDADQDGKKDLMITPHAEGSSENYKTMQFYRNTGTTSSPVFTLQKDTFLVDQMIDVGTGAYPMLYDYDKDGKPDLLVGSDGYYQSGVLRSKIAYYRNTSSGPGSPSFEFQTYNLLQMDTADLKGSALAAGDLNNDGKDDLIVGQSDGTLSLYLNTAPSNSVQPAWTNLSTKIRDMNNVVIDVGQNAAPFIYDMDNDGKRDLVIGTMLGYFVYYQNVSTVPNQVKLKLINTRLGDVKTDPQFTYKGYSTPFIGLVDDGGYPYLLSGSSTGAIYRFQGFQGGDTTATWQQIDSLYSFIKGLGVRTAPTVADIDGNGLMDMIIGTQTGGLLMYRQMFPLSGSEKPILPEADKVSLYPNPAKNTLFVKWNDGFSSGQVDISIVNTIGQKMLTQSFAGSHSSVQVDITSLPAGVYFCITRSGTKESVNTLSIYR